jgi:hypothetical protein
LEEELNLLGKYVFKIEDKKSDLNDEDPPITEYEYFITMPTSNQPLIKTKNLLMYKEKIQIKLK